MATILRNFNEESALVQVYDYEEQVNDLTREAFGKDFVWGIAMAAFQNEGAWDKDGKGESIWDRFTHKKGKIKDRNHAEVATDFYHRFEEDIQHTKALGFNTFRFSISWSRILPNGVGQINRAGLEFYHQLIDKCHEYGLEPWVTLYHWDLPQALEDMGGWTNREIIDWFSEYCEIVTEEFAHKVKYWMVLNEPAGFTGLGYMTGYHAPGRMGMSNFLPAVHNTAMCQAEGGRIIRKNIPEAIIGTTFSFSHVEAHRPHKHADVAAAKRIDALMNRLFLEPALGLGYPVEELPFLKTMVKKYVHEGDMERLAFDFDFIGVQNYFKIVAKNAWWMPYINATEVKPHKRQVTNLTELGWEISPDGMYETLKQVGAYPQVRQIVVTENGAAFEDHLTEDGRVHDLKRTQFYHHYLLNVLKAKREGVKVNGYLAWTLTDNFEWTEGFKPRFGLIHVDFKTQKRTLKDSALWFQGLLRR
ncbi:MAG: GH1 family beta-glucosidase [Spirosomataceae bacterium]